MSDPAGKETVWRRLYEAEQAEKRRQQEQETHERIVEARRNGGWNLEARA